MPVLLYLHCLCFCRCSRFRCLQTSSAQLTWLAATPTWTRAPLELRLHRRAPDHRARRTTRPSRRASSSSCSPSDTSRPISSPTPSTSLTSTPPPRRSVHQTHPLSLSHLFGRMFGRTQSRFREVWLSVGYSGPVVFTAQYLKKNSSQKEQQCI